MTRDDELSTFHWLLVRAAHQSANPPKVLGSYTSRKEADAAQAQWGGRILELECQTYGPKPTGEWLVDVIPKWIEP